MTDKELIEMAAKAAGRDVIWKRGMHRSEPHEGLFDRGTGCVTSWNPLTDDGDALRLAVELSFIDEGDWPQVTNEIYDHCGGDWFSSTRRAITMAASKIGKEME